MLRFHSLANLLHPSRPPPNPLPRGLPLEHLASIYPHQVPGPHLLAADLADSATDRERVCDTDIYILEECETVIDIV